MFIVKPPFVKQLFKKAGYLLLLTLSTFQVLQAQPLTRSTFVAPYIAISTGNGATVSTATGDNVNETGIPIGFSFVYGDSTFTTIGLSTNGVIWFDAVAPTVTAGNVNLVTTTSPNQTLAPWWNNLNDDVSSEILYQTQGSPGSRTFTVQYTNYPTFTGTAGTNVRMNCQVILYETSNIIEFRYGSLNVTGLPTTSGGAMIGLEWGSGGNGKFIDAVTGSSIVSHRLLSPLSGWPNYHFRFTPGTPSSLPSGNYTVGIGQQYNSLTQAIADVNHRGISGAVTLQLTDAQYDTTIGNGSNIFPILIATPNSSATNRLTLEKTGSAAVLAYRGSDITAGGFGTGVSTSAILGTSEPILGVCASYTTIRNLNLMTHGSAQVVEHGLLVFELFSNKGAQNNYFDKISVDLNRAHPGSIGIYSVNTTAPGGIPGTNSYNTYRDISIKDCGAGFSLSGVNSATGPADYDNKIITSSPYIFNMIGDPLTPNDISATGTYGLSIGGQNGFTVSNCIIQNITSTSASGSATGISITNSFGNNIVSNNTLRNIRRNANSSNASFYAAGMVISYDNQVMNFKIYNNSISGLSSGYTGAPSASRILKGIFFADVGAGNVTAEIWNNSISIDGSSCPNVSSTCIDLADGDDKTFIFKNNIFANFTSAQTPPAAHYCFVTPLVDRYGNINAKSDFNDLYIANDASVSGFVGRGSTTNYTTLPQWQAGMSFNTGTDINSIHADPFFVNNTSDLHATNSSGALNNSGTTQPGYAFLDADGDVRNNPPDIGMDEFTNNAIRLNINLVIEGYYQGANAMNPVLLNTGSNVHPLMCDSITVEIHADTAPYSLVSSTQAVLKTDGKASAYLPTGLLGGSYYIVVKGRNMIETWSKFPVLLTTTTSYSFY